MENKMKISAQKAQQLIDRGAALIDVRNPVDFAKGTARGAVNIVLRNVSSLRVKYKTSDTLVLVGAADDDSDLRQFENYAEQMGFTKVHSVGAITNLMK
jgi:rhodanese-related sulfurtransferase